MKMPENRDVMDTARFPRVRSIPSEPWMPGMTFNRVCANSQKLMTARTMPISHASFGFHWVWVFAEDWAVLTAYASLAK
jgi:hypothetical protein